MKKKIKKTKKEKGISPNPSGVLNASLFGIRVFADITRVRITMKSSLVRVDPKSSKSVPKNDGKGRHLKGRRRQYHLKRHPSRGWNDAPTRLDGHHQHQAERPRPGAATPLE